MHCVRSGQIPETLVQVERAVRPSSPLLIRGFGIPGRSEFLALFPDQQQVREARARAGYCRWSPAATAKRSVAQTCPLRRCQPARLTQGPGPAGRPTRAIVWVLATGRDRCATQAAGANSGAIIRRRQATLSPFKRSIYVPDLTSGHGKRHWATGGVAPSHRGDQRVRGFNPSACGRYG